MNFIVMISKARKILGKINFFFKIVRNYDEKQYGHSYTLST